MPLTVFSNVGPLGNNVYVVWDQATRRAMLVDTAIQSESVWDYLRQENLTLSTILNTHGHLDHVYNNAFFKAKAPDAPLLLHKADMYLLESMQESAQHWGISVEDSPTPDGFLEGGAQLTLGETALDVLHTPGHTPGSVSLYAPGWVITGDALFRGSIGRTDLPGGSLPTILGSIKTQLFTLPDDTLVYPGHGADSTIGEEKETNPFLQEGYLRRAGYM